MSLSVSMSGMQVANTYMSAASHNIANTNTEDFRPQGGSFIRVSLCNGR